MDGQLMMTVKARVPVHPLASVARMVKLNVPAAVGVPVKAPPEASVNPVGSVPALVVNV
jgi:hypothetical protein